MSCANTLYNIKSDEIGNITNIGDVTLDWNGRRLKGISQDGLELVSYDYNVDGQRVKKTALDLENTGDGSKTQGTVRKHRGRFYENTGDGSMC